jgi:hypothetical protein
MIDLSSFEPISVIDTRKLIALTLNKQCVLYVIPTWIVKESVDELIPFITEIINLSLKHSLVSNSMKNTIVTPLLKKPSFDPDQLKNYRPISNLSFVSKLLEKWCLNTLLNINKTIASLTQCSLLMLSSLVKKQP